MILIPNIIIICFYENGCVIKNHINISKLRSSNDKVSYYLYI
ncbi:UNVERIFIED_ORG: hypothetical protein J2Y93_001466 [Pantoea agglomerans]